VDFARFLSPLRNRRGSLCSSISWARCLAIARPRRSFEEDGFKGAWYRFIVLALAGRAHSIMSVKRPFHVRGLSFDFPVESCPVIPPHLLLVRRGDLMAVRLDPLFPSLTRASYFSSPFVHVPCKKSSFASLGKLPRFLGQKHKLFLQALSTVF